MEDLQNITIQATERCLGFIINNIAAINEGKATHLLADFRANKGGWKSLVSFPNSSLQNVTEEQFKDKAKLYFIFLMNDGSIEGIVYLLGNNESSKMTFTLKVCVPSPVGSDRFNDRVRIIERVRSS